MCNHYIFHQSHTIIWDSVEPPRFIIGLGLKLKTVTSARS
jgi:hypothetical protein